MAFWHKRHIVTYRPWWSNRYFKRNITRRFSTRRSAMRHISSNYDQYKYTYGSWYYTSPSGTTRKVEL